MTPSRILKIKSNQTVISRNCIFATSVRARMVGLLNHARLLPGEAMMIGSCNQVHTLFMRFSIDAVFLSKELKVLEIKELAPWRITGIVWKAKSVLELPRGTSKSLGLNVGDQLEVSTC